MLYLVFLLFIQANCMNEEGYYWREYTGAIPSDAVVGGKDTNGKNVYIAQAYIKDMGLCVAQINPGVIEVRAAMHGLQTINRYIKILCGSQNRFEWVPATSTNLHTILLGKHSVIGGHEDNWGAMNIGRIKQQGSDKIGKINTFNLGDSLFYYDNNGEEGVHVKSYDVLLYKINGNVTDGLIENIFKDI